MRKSLIISALIAFLAFIHPVPLGGTSAALLPAQSGVAAEQTTWSLYLPAVGHQRGGLVVDTANRQQVIDFYRQYHLSSENVSADWTGAHASCDPGSTSTAFRNASLTQINYYRAMAGVPADIVFSEEWNRKAQQAALMMSANDELDHYPDQSWTCYSEEGAEAAGSSNLSIGNSGIYAIRSQFRDAGDNNYRAGHRWWILFPVTQVMGTGDIPSTGDYRASNALWVVDRDHLADPHPQLNREYVAWPPPGYVPYPVVYPRWSFVLYRSIADFSSASVEMFANGTQVPIIVEYNLGHLVWRPESLSDRSPWPVPAGDTPYRITIRNVLFNGEPRDFTYEVIIFDPNT